MCRSFHHMSVRKPSAKVQLQGKASTQSISKTRYVLHPHCTSMSTHTLNLAPVATVIAQKHGNWWRSMAPARLLQRGCQLAGDAPCSRAAPGRSRCHM